MQITEVRVNPMHTFNSRLKAMATVTFDDCFAVRGIKIVEAADSKLIVCMPSNKSTIACVECGRRVDSDSSFCKHCGKSLPINPGEYNAREDRRDIAHPINRDKREYINTAVLTAYQEQQKN